MNKNDVALIIIIGIILTIILIISFYYNNSYIQSLSIASLPIGIGVITTKLLTDRWQIKNEKSKIKRSVLEDFQNSSKRIALLIDNFMIQLATWYSQYQRIDDIPSTGEVSFQNVEIPNEPTEQPMLKFSHDYKLLEDKISEARFHASSFISSVKLYYKNEQLLTEFNSLQRNLFYERLLIRKLMLAQSTQDFIEVGNHIKNKHTEIKNTIKVFENKIVELELDKSVI